MQLFKFNILVLLLTVSLVSCKSEPEIKTVGEEEIADINAIEDPNATYAKAEFEIEGMTCAMGCAKTIEKKLAKVDGVKSAKVDFDTRMAMVEYNAAKVSHNSLEDAVTKAGDVYKVVEVKNVEEFGSKAQCNMACCNGKTAEEKANCMNDCCEAEGKVCSEDCKKECCVDKKKI